MLEYRAEVEIEAPASRVWEILTDADGYDDWDNGVVRVDGKIADGQRITVHSEVSPGRAFPVRVGDWAAPRAMTWTGGMPLGLFKGVRRFSLDEAGGTTTFAMHEVFSGPMLPLISRSMPDLQPSFDRFAEGLRAAAEA